MVTCGLLVFAVLVSAGMAEWSKRSAADEVIVTEKILQEAIQIAAERKMEDRRSSQPQHAGGWTTASRSEMGSSPSAISQLRTASGSERAGVEK